MRGRRKLYLLITLALLAASPSRSDLLISSSSTAGFQTGVVPNNDGTPYWDNPSSNGANCNIGFVLDGSAPSTCVGAGLPLGPDDLTGDFPYWGNSDGTADMNFFFAHQNASEASLEVRLSRNTPSAFDVFGYYTAAASSQLVLHPLFNGGSPMESTASIAGSAVFGFYITHNVQGTPETYFTQSRLNTTDTTHQHFAVFRADPAGTQGRIVTQYYIGAEDHSGTGTDFDYNDMVVQISPVPEPESLALLATALATCAVVLFVVRSSDGQRRAR